MHHREPASESGGARPAADGPRPAVVSASRRTDIPAFYGEWLMNRTGAGFCRYRSRGGAPRKVSLAADDVLAFVFWSRDYGRMIEQGHLRQLRARGYDFFMHFTIVDHPPRLDPRGIAADEAVEQFRFLSESFGKDAVCWRFDPIVLSPVTPLEERVATFAGLAGRLGPYTERCIISVMDPYAKTRRNLSRRDIAVYDPLGGSGPVSWEELKAALKEMAATAAGAGIRLYTCCERRIREASELDIARGHCIDREWVARIVRDPRKRDMVRRLPGDRGQRRSHDCGCYRSVDIGAYNTCAHGCVYCYANESPELSLRRYASHDPAAEML